MPSADIRIIPKITQFTRRNLASKATDKQVKNPPRHVCAARFACTLLMIAYSMINSLPQSSHLRTEAVAPGLWHGAMVHVVLDKRVAGHRDADAAEDFAQHGIGKREPCRAPIAVQSPS